MAVTTEVDKLTEEVPANDANSVKRLNEEDINTIKSVKSEQKNKIVAHGTKNHNSSKFDGLGDIGIICSDESEEDRLPPIPDGGWGWVVVVSAFLVSACANGLESLFLLLNEELSRYFETTLSKTVLIRSLFIATPLLAGPIMSTLVDRYGCRNMTMIAGVLSFIGCLLASISNSMEMLCLTFGFLSVPAMGILYITAIVSVAFWFHKKRILVISLTSYGIGFGTFIYTPLTHYLTDNIGRRNTIYVLAGTMLIIWVCGALMRDPEWLIMKQKRKRRLSKTRSRRFPSARSASSRSNEGESEYLDADNLKSLRKSGKRTDYVLATLATSIAAAEKLQARTQMNAEQSYKKIQSVIHLPTFIQQNEKVPAEVIKKVMENKRLYKIILHYYPDLLIRRRPEANLNVESQSPDTVFELAKSPKEIKAKNPMDKLDYIQYENKKEDHKDKKDDTTKSNSNVNSAHYDRTKRKHDINDATIKVKHLPRQTSWVRQISTMPLYRNTMMHRGAMINIPRYKLRASSLPDIYKNSTWSIELSVKEMTWHDRLFKVMKSTFIFKVFTEFHRFLIFNLSSLILSVWNVVFGIFFDEFIMEIGLAVGDMLILMGVIGVSKGVGIIVFGCLGDRPWINVTKAYAICVIIGGLSVAIYPLMTRYWALVIVSAVYGLSFSSSYSYTPAILMELVPIDRFTVAYGMILLNQGIGHLLGPPIGGLIFEITGTWDLTFFVAGICQIISGVLVGVVAYTKDVRMCGDDQLLKEAEKRAEEVEEDVSV